MASIQINGQTFVGNNIVVKNGKVIIDGKEAVDTGSAEVKVEVTGNVDRLECNTCTITGDVTGDVDANTVNCGNIEGDVDANTINCGNIGGDVDANIVNRR